MARTIAQIEADIQSAVALQIMEYTKDYIVPKLNVEFGNLNLSMQNIKTYVSGISQITSQLGKPLAPANAHPTDAADLVEGNWYFNKVQKKFFMYHSSKWEEIADLSHIVDTKPLKIITKQYTTWDEIFADKDYIVSLAGYPKAQIDWFGAAIRKDNTMFFTLNATDRGWGFQGSYTMSNNTYYKTTLAGADGVKLFNQGTQVGTSGIALDKFTWTAELLEGKTISTGGGGTPTFGTLEELYKVENGETVTDSDIKVLHLEEIAELVKDQREIDKNFLAEFTDELTYIDATHIGYKDKDLGITTLKAEVTKVGNNISYSTLIKPYDRIQQEQASFEGTFAKNGMSVEYLFTSKGKAVKFSGNAGQSYKWETFGKFESGARVPYIRFSGTGTLETSNDALNPSPTFTTQTMPYEVKLSDLMDDINRTALVSMHFATPPVIGDRILDISYLTSTFFIQQRFGGFIKEIEEDKADKRLLFETQLTEVRNHSINVQPATPFPGATNPAPYTLKKGIDNSWATNDDRLIINIFDTDSKRVFASYYDDANADANTYSGQPAVTIELADGTKKKVYLAIWTSADPEGATIDFMEFDGVTRYNLPFHYELYITVDSAAAVSLKADKSFVDTELAKKLDLNLGNVKSDAEKKAFIDGLKALGVDTGLWNEFHGFLASNPTSNINDKDWYFNTTDNSIHAFYGGAWHQIGGGTTGTTTMDRTTMLGVLGLTQANLNSLANLTNLLAAKVDVTAFNNERTRVNSEIASKQNTLTKTLTVEFTDGSTENFLVG